MNWEDVLRANDQIMAKEMVLRLKVHRHVHGEDFDGFAKIIGYHYTNVWDRETGEVSPHLRRVLVEIRLLGQFHIKSTFLRDYGRG